MTPGKWFLLTLGGAAIIAYAAWWYRTREEPVAGRGWAASLRAATLLVAWVILLNPSWPAVLERQRGREVVLLDASYSMSRPSRAGGATLWRLAIDSAARFQGAWLFGGAVPEYVTTDSIPDAPVYYESRLAPALRAAARSGARRVVILSDGDISDAAEVAEEAGRLALSVSIQRLGTMHPRLGIADVRTSGWVQIGDTAIVNVEIVAAAPETDSVEVQLLDERGEGERVLATTKAAVPAAGRFSAARLSFPVVGRPGLRRYVARLADTLGDVEERDDERVFYIRATQRPAGPVLISLRPDWEPSFLLPSLDRVSEEPGTAYLWLGESGPVRVGDNYATVQLSDVLQRARAAPLLVLHGYGADAPEWARELARNANRLLLFPIGDRPFQVPGSEVAIGAPAQAEWYASSDVPQSPLVLELGDLPAGQLPPLLRVRAVRAAQTWTPLTVQRLRRGDPAPAIVAGTGVGRRWVIATAEGYWRWAFRQGAGRQLYQTLWTGLAGWLTEGRREAGPGLDPERRVVARDQPLRWATPGGADSVSMELETDEAGLVWSGTGVAGDSVDASLPPGRYRYIARAYRGDRVAASTAGPAEVEQFARELLPSTATLSEALPGSQSAEAGAHADREGRQLATLGWPYLLLITLFCFEWAVRRLIGLR